MTKQGLNEIDAVIMTANDLGLKMPVCARFTYLTIDTYIVCSFVEMLSLENFLSVLVNCASHTEIILFFCISYIGTLPVILFDCPLESELSVYHYK